MKVVFVLDRSGSMFSMKEEAVGGFNGYKAGLKKKDKLTLVQFDDKYQVDCEKVSPKDFDDLVLGETYQPRGCTALLDAVGTAITSQGDAKKVFFVVLTDGMENASKEYSQSQINGLIKDREARGWQFEWLAEQGVKSAIQQSFNIDSKFMKTFDATDKGSLVATYTSSIGTREAYRSA